MATADGAWYRSPRARRGLVAGVVLLVQLVALGLAYRAGRPTLYAYFLVVSTAGVAYTLEHDAGPVVGLGAFLLGQVGAAGLALAVHRAVGAVGGTAPELGVQLWLLVWLVAGVPATVSAVRRVDGLARGVGAGVAAALLTLVGSVLVGAGFDVFLPLWAVLYLLLGAVAVGLTLEGSLFTVGAATTGSVLLVALALPLALFVARQSPSVVVEKLLDPDVHRVLYLGVYGPLLAALVSLVFGVPLAHLLARGFTGQSLVESLVDLPLVVPHSVAGIIILFGFGQGGAFPGVPILGTVVGMVLAMTFVSAPYAVNAAREAFETIDDRLEYAARAHGADRFETFRRVTGPLAVRGIVTGGVLAWARAVSEFGAVAVVAYSLEFFYPFAGAAGSDAAGVLNPLTGETVRAQHAPVFVYNTYLQGGLSESGAVAFLLLAVSALIFLLVRWLTDDSGGVVR